MQEIILEWIKSTYLFLPAYLANTAPVITSLILKKKLATPLDLGKKWRGKRILGDHKTIRGVIAAMIIGGAVFWLQKIIYNNQVWKGISLINYDEKSIIIGIMLGLGAITGDAVKSFFKRRKGIKPGEKWFPYDQIDFTIGGLPIIIALGVPIKNIIIILANGLIIPTIVETIIGKKIKKKIREK